MAVESKKCLICGTPFKPCSTITEGLNWRRLFCSPECCQEYVRRSVEPVAQQVEPEIATDTEEVVVKPSKRKRTLVPEDA